MSLFIRSGSIYEYAVLRSGPAPTRFSSAKLFTCDSYISVLRNGFLKSVILCIYPSLHCSLLDYEDMLTDMGAPEFGKNIFPQTAR